MPVQLKPGVVLHKRYKIDHVIGQGGKGCIYLAEDLRLAGRMCAVKEVEHDPSLPEDALRETREQFHQEATILARLDHPNLPKVSDFFSILDNDYLVMDYVPGDDLRTLMLKASQAGKVLPEKEVISWATQLGDALTHLHGQEPPILHRDIKPSNLKLTPSGLLKLVDFGLARLLAPGEVTITIMQGQGTAQYTPLEQYGGDSVHTDVRSDIYSFAATLYHLLTNQPPANVRDRFLDPTILVAPRQYNAAISPRTERAILWGLQLHPADRPSSVQAFIRALTEESSPLSKGITNHRKQQIMQPLEKAMAAVAGGLALIGLILSLIRIF